MIKNLFKLDLRSLALARVLLGIVCFFDIGRRISDIDTFFTDAGMLPRWTMLEQYELSWRMTIFSLNGSYTFVLIVTLIGMLASLFYALGWRTRISNFIVWLTIISFQARFPEGATSGGDMLLRIFLFWSLFLPMSGIYSVDRAVSKKTFKSNEYFSVFSTIWIVQIMLLYIMTFLYKWAPVYHTDFDAVWFMLQLDIFTTPVGKWLGEQYRATQFLSFSAYALEIVGPLLLFIPWKRDLFRGIAVLSFWLFHLGIGLTLHLGNFVPICLIIWVGLIPTAWWNYLAVKVKSSKEALLTLYYDQQSEFSQQLAFISKELLFLDNVKIAPAITKKMILKDQNNVQVAEEQFFSQLLLSSKISPIRFFGKILRSDLGINLSTAKEAGEINVFGGKSAAAVNQHPTQVIKKALQSTFETIGFGKVKYGLNKFEKVMGTFLLLLVVSWNIEGYVEDRDWYIGSPFDEIMFSLHLNQGWSMFAPHPQRSDGWWVMEGNLKDGKQWDALNNKEVTFERPSDIYETFPSEDWRKFLDNLQGTRDEKYLLLLGKHLCRSWNKEHGGDEALSTFKLHFMQEFTNGPKEPPAKVNKITLWNHNCF